MLDLQLYVEDEQIKYEFFEKPCANKFVIPAQSAHSKKMRMSVLVEEGMRRLRNCARGLDGEVRRRVMTSWAMKLRRSGYPATTRHQVISEAVTKFRKMCETEDSGGRPIHRPREWCRAARRLEKERKSTNWHKSSEDKISAPLIIDPTAGELTEKLRAACKKFGDSQGLEVSVRLRAGRSVASDCKPEPLRKPECGREKCLCCSSGNPGGCEINSVGYKIWCGGCQRAGVEVKYDGETGRNAHSRGLDHQRDLEGEKDESPLWKHCQLEHDEEKQEFKMEVLKSFKSCLERQINEAVRITSSKADIQMNSKSEFHQAPIVRVVAARGLQAGQGEEEGWVAVRGRGRGARRGRGGARGEGRRHRGV